MVEPLAAFSAYAGYVKAAKVTWDALMADRFSPLALAKAWPDGLEDSYAAIEYRADMPKTRTEAVRFIGGQVAAVQGLLSISGNRGDISLRTSMVNLAWAEVAAAYREGRPFKRCRNEPCQRWFSIQNTATKSGQHRPSRAEYCSYKCQQAQKSRERRRTKKAREGSK